ncbi:hypothetical protein U5L97_02020 [Salmonella enterica]|nr:hypothetical protein U5L97_02020 [Salmonella enterica]
MMTDNVNLMNGDEQTASSLSEETSKTPPLSPELLKNSPYSSIAKVKYFTEIEQICLDKSISTENLDQFFKAHWLRDKMGVFCPGSGDAGGLQAIRGRGARGSTRD